MIRGIPVVDMQHHYMSPDALRFVGKTEEYDFSIGLKRFRKAYEVMQKVDKHLAFMDASGIDTAILSSGSFTPNGYQFCRACNSGYGTVVKEHPDRFRGTIQVYPRDKEVNPDEVKRCVEELGLWGLAVATSYSGTTADSPVMDHLYELALQYGMPVYIHPTIRVNLWGGERYDLYTTLSREYEIAKSFVEIVYGVLPRFPDLKVIMAHFGGGLPALKGRLLAWHQPPEIVIPEEDKGHGRSIEEAMDLGLVDDFEKRTENILFDSAGCGGWMPVIESAFRTLGSGRICFGTDYPYELNKPVYTRKILDDICQLDVTEEDKKNFLSGNLKRFFRL